jgi:hypothetical protein
LGQRSSWERSRNIPFASVLGIPLTVRCKVEDLLGNQERRPVFSIHELQLVEGRVVCGGHSAKNFKIEHATSFLNHPSDGTGLPAAVEFGRK